MRHRLLLTVMVMLTLWGCKQASTSSACGSEAAVAATEEMFAKLTDQKVRALLDSETRLEGYDAAQLRAALSSISIKLHDVRTTKKDPDSSRNFCAARFEFKLPGTVIEGAESARTIAEADNLSKLAHQKGVRKSGGAWEDDLEYSIQPTDDGGKLIAEADKDASIFDFIGDVYISYLLSDDIREKKVGEDKAEAAEVAAENAAEREMDQALTERAAANLNEARVANKMTAERIAAVWDAIPEPVQKQLKPLQQAWNKKTSAQCKVEAAGSSEYKADRQAVRLRCESQAHLSRIRELERYASYNNEYDE
ncbi:MAG: hypothetical protein V3V15_02320 [Sphingorhabdus sp.]